MAEPPPLHLGKARDRGPPGKVSCLDQGHTASCTPCWDVDVCLLSLSARCCHQTLLALAELNSESICYPKAPGTIPARYEYRLVFMAALEGKYSCCHPCFLDEVPEDPRVGGGVPGSHTEPSVPLPVLLTMRLCWPRREDTSDGQRRACGWMPLRCFDQNEQGAQHPEELVSGK